MTLRPRKMLARYPNANPERQLFSRGYANELQLVRRRLHGAMAAAAPFSTSWRSSHLCSRPPSSAQQDRVPFTTLVGSTSGQPSDRPALNHIRVRGCARSAPTIKTSQWSHKTTFVLAHGYKTMVPPAGPVAARFLILIIQSPGVRRYRFRSTTSSSTRGPPASARPAGSGTSTTTTAPRCTMTSRTSRCTRARRTTSGTRSGSGRTSSCRCAGVSHDKHPRMPSGSTMLI